MTIKQFIYTIIILLFSLPINAQKNKIGFFYGFGGNDLLRNTSLDGGASYDGKGTHLFGLAYQRVLNGHFSLETGLEYSKNSIKIKPEYIPGKQLCGTSVSHERIVNIKMITIPVYARFTFFKYFYANAGTLIDFEFDRDEYQSTDEQSGIGFGAGIGGQYTFHNFTLYINPMLRHHAVIPFHKENYQQHLTEAGIKFGLEYNF